MLSYGLSSLTGKYKSIFIWKTNTHPLSPICICFFMFTANAYRINLNKSNSTQSLSDYSFGFVFKSKMETLLQSQGTWDSVGSEDPVHRSWVWLGSSSLGAGAQPLLPRPKATTAKAPGHTVSPRELSCPMKTPQMQVSKIILGFRHLHRLDFAYFRCYSEYLHTPRSLLRR